ncbi:MAG: hypothetical protein RQ753_01975 [Desulfurivibrionaceae bacterium]|nr:hypothetical protein [Desulfobulbales bacterium]MDT8334444.1 hypothetical protein [Desulfurivibrionaceae bacterium]
MTRQSKVDEICDHVRAVFNPPRIRFLKIAKYPASCGLRISFDYRNGVKTITFSKKYLDEHSEEQLAGFLDKAKLAKLMENGDQHLELD